MPKTEGFVIWNVKSDKMDIGSPKQMTCQIQALDTEMHHSACPWQKLKLFRGTFWALECFQKLFGRLNGFKNFFGRWNFFKIFMGSLFAEVSLPFQNWIFFYMCVRAEQEYWYNMVQNITRIMIATFMTIIKLECLSFYNSWRAEMSTSNDFSKRSKQLHTIMGQNLIHGLCEIQM